MLFALLLIFAAQAKSQILISLLLGDKLNNDRIEFGLDGGVNYSNIKGLPSSSTAPFFNVGFYFDIKTNNPKWLFHTGVIVKSTVGAQDIPTYTTGNASVDSVFVDGSVFRKINYFHVPIMMKYKFTKRFFVEGGIAPALRTSAFDFFTQTIVDKDDLEYKKDVKDQFHRLDFGLIGGFGYRLMGGNGMNLGFRYYYGLVDVLISDASPDQYIQSLYLYVGIPIGAGKAKEN
jgi:hypothetical protein